MPPSSASPLATAVARRRLPARRARRARRAWAAALVGICLAGLAACVEPDRPVVALLLAGDRADRWTTVDEPTFRARVRETCENCRYVVHNAEEDPAAQARQLTRAIEAGADVVVLNPVDSERAEELVVQAGEVPVVAYDRFVAGADWFVSVDPTAIGEAMGRAVVQQLPEGARALVVEGAAGDANAAAIAVAVRSRLDRGGVRVVGEVTPQDWSTEAARTQVARELRSAGRVDAVVASNDNQAAGAVAALRAADVDPWPVVTGQDAQLDALRRIITGRQAITVYKPFRDQARRAADVAIRELTGDPIRGAEDHEGVPSFLFEPQVVDLASLTTVVVGDGAWRLDEICAGDVQARCRALGLV